MNKFLISVFICTLVCFGADEAFQKEYNDLINNITQPRAGLSEAQMNSVLDPFSMESQQFVKSKDDSQNIESIVYKLSAVLANRAKINGRWYKQGDDIDAYKIDQINFSSVRLINNTEVINLKLTSKENKNVSISW